MNIAMSNIAWTNDDEPDIARALGQNGLRSIELAPTKRWNDPTTIFQADAKEYVEWWKRHNIEVVAFQSMLFTRPDLTIFDDATTRSETVEYLKRFLRLAGWMGARRLVFGSPKNRQRKELSLDKANDIAAAFFKELGMEARNNGVILCLEPNAPQYNCDFITNAAEGEALVRRVDDKGFQLHLDTACMALAGDNFTSSIESASDILAHFHASSPMLETVEAQPDVDHRAAADALRSVNYEGYVSIEMKPDETVAASQRAMRALRFIQAEY